MNLCTVLFSGSRNDNSSSNNLYENISTDWDILDLKDVQVGGFAKVENFTEF